MHFPTLSLPALLPLFLLLQTRITHSSPLSLSRRQTVGPDTDFSGNGRIYVVPSHDLQTADPNNKIGCLTAAGRFVPTSSSSQCGTFYQDPNGAQLRSTSGACSFGDPSAEIGTPMGPQGYAFKCAGYTGPAAAVYSLNMSDAGPGQAWIWTGNLNPYFETTSLPGPGENRPVWYYTFTGTRTYIMLLFVKL